MIEYISQLKRIDNDLLDSLYNEVKETEINWVDSFLNYQSGGWQIASLYNSTGDEMYDVPKESDIKPTPLIKRMPRMKAFIDSMGLDYLMARLTRSLPNSYLYEHADYGGLDKREKLRLHIPLYTHSRAVMSLTDVNVHLKRGFLWKRDPKAAIHGVCNVGGEERVHLLLDCYMNPVLESLLNAQWLDQDTITEVPELTQEKKESLMQQAKELLLQGKAQEAEPFLLSTFYDFRHPKGSSSYELILTLYEENHPEQERIDYWLDRMKEVYGETHVQRHQTQVGT